MPRKPEQAGVRGAAGGEEVLGGEKGEVENSAVLKGGQGMFGVKSKAQLLTL